MRINSPRQIEASRQNGLKSSGPKSIKGKNSTRLNALKHGLFSQEIIIESAGERLEDFEQFKKEIWEDYQPAGAMEELLVTDIVENAWRRLRVRRCETTEMNSRIKAAEIRDRLEYMKKIEKLKCEFMGRFHSLLGPALIDGLGWDNQVQEALASTFLGMDFLMLIVDFSPLLACTRPSLHMQVIAQVGIRTLMVGCVTQGLEPPLSG
jgi:hypothetical protein